MSGEKISGVKLVNAGTCDGKVDIWGARPGSQTREATEAANLERGAEAPPIRMYGYELRRSSGRAQRRKEKGRLERVEKVDSQIGKSALHGRVGRMGAAGVFIVRWRLRKRGQTTGVVSFRG